MPGDPGTPERAAGQHSTPGAGPPGAPPGPGQILSDLALLRRRTRRARHAYWFPLALFGLLTCAAAPLYAWASAPVALSPAPVTRAGPAALGGPFLLGGRPVGTAGVYLEWYWAFALIGGFLLTWLWYSRHARRAGVRTPVRGAVVAGVILSIVILAMPPLTVEVLPWFAAGDLWMRGAVAFLVIAAVLWMLTWAERSPALAAIALVYTATALLSCLYDVENAAFLLGWNPGPGLAGLPGVLLPAVVLLAAGAGAFVAQHGHRTA